MNFKLNKTDKMRCVTFFAMVYIVVAFGWWSILLLRKNEELWQSQLETFKIQEQVDGKLSESTPQYLTAKMHHEAQSKMIWGEGLFLFAGLIWGVYIINRSFRKEIALANQQRNFLLSVTHELRSPISSIQLVLQTFLKRKLDEKQVESLSNSALKESERLNELVNNLLLSAKLETSFVPLFEDLKVNQIIEEIIAKLKFRFPKANFKFENKELPAIKADRQCLVSLFTNLLENAVKYSNQSADIQLNNRIENNSFVFEVMDKGIGIANDEKERIFEKFYRVGNEETRTSKGTGLGLFIVSQIVKAHQGTVQVLDNQPQGSIFKVSIPYS